MDAIQKVVDMCVDTFQVCAKPPRDILIQWTLDLMKIAEQQSNLKGEQKLLLVQTALLALLHKHTEIFESASLWQLFVKEEVPAIVFAAVAFSKDSSIGTKCKCF